MATEYGNRLRTARKLRGMTQMDLSKATGIPQSTISTAEREGTKSLETTTYATALKIRPEWLSAGEGEMEPSGILARLQADLPVAGLNHSAAYHRLRQRLSPMGGPIPLLNKDNAGMYNDYMDGTVTPPLTYQYHDDPTGLFAFTVPDDLMEPRIPRGCTAIINTIAQPQHGKLVLILDGETAYIRRLVIDGELRYQETTSGRLPARPMTGTIIGTVKEVVINLDDWT